MYNSLTQVVVAEPNYRRGAWAPACAGHVFTLATAFNSAQFEIPQQTGENTLHETLYRFVMGSDENVKLIDQVDWPANGQCAFYKEQFTAPDLEMAY